METYPFDPFDSFNELILSITGAIEIILINSYNLRDFTIEIDKITLIDKMSNTYNINYIIHTNNNINIKSFRLNKLLNNKVNDLIFEDKYKINKINSIIYNILNNDIELDVNFIIVNINDKYFEELPEDSILEIVSTLNFKEIRSICLLTKKYKKICNNPRIWEHTLKSQFPYAHNIIYKIINNSTLSKLRLWKLYFKELSESKYDDMTEYYKYGIISKYDDGNLLYEAIKNKNIIPIKILAYDNNYNPEVSNISDDIFDDNRLSIANEKDIYINIQLLLNTEKFEQYINYNDLLSNFIYIDKYEIAEYIIKNFMTEEDIVDYIINYNPDEHIREWIQNL